MPVGSAQATRLAYMRCACPSLCEAAVPARAPPPRSPLTWVVLPSPQRWNRSTIAAASRSAPPRCAAVSRPRIPPGPQPSYLQASRVEDLAESRAQAPGPSAQTRSVASVYAACGASVMWSSRRAKRRRAGRAGCRSA
eukprot:scaffold243385_cov26-Tisochrysis_lutea.AAC.2